MQAAVRAALSRIVEGFATAVVVWSGSPTCPACSPTFQCPEQLRCPDCFCNGGARVVKTEREDYGFFAVSAAFFAGILLGFLGAVALGSALLSSVRGK